MTTISFPEKDPDERDDFKLHWSNRIAPLGDTIPDDGSLWEIVTDQTGSLNPLNIYDSDVYNAGLSTRVWLEGGVAGQTYELLNTVVTAGARTLQRTVKIKVKEH